MTRSQLEAVLLADVAPAAGPVGVAAVEALLGLARDLGAGIERGTPSWSFRLGGAPGASTQDVTLFLLSTKGTLWVRWLDRWERAGVRPAVAAEYEYRLVALFGQSVKGRQMHTEKAVGLRTVAKHLHELQAILRDAVAGMRETGAGRPLV